MSTAGKWAICYGIFAAVGINLPQRLSLSRESGKKTIMNDNIIRQITADDLRTMNDQESLVLQSCGGPLQEWVDGINGLLTESGILLDGSRFGQAFHVAHSDPRSVRRNVAV